MKEQPKRKHMNTPEQARSNPYQCVTQRIHCGSSFQLEGAKPEGPGDQKGTGPKDMWSAWILGGIPKHVISLDRIALHRLRQERRRWSTKCTAEFKCGKARNRPKHYGILGGPSSQMQRCTLPGVCTKQRASSLHASGEHDSGPMGCVPGIC